MKEKTIYVANDGKEFTTEKECINYETNVETETIDSLVDNLCNERKSIQLDVEKAEETKVAEILDAIQPKLAVFLKAEENFRKLDYQATFEHTSGESKLNVYILKHSWYNTYSARIKCNECPMNEAEHIEHLKKNNDYWYSKNNRYVVFGLGRALDKVSLETIQDWYKDELNKAIASYKKENERLKNNIIY